MRCFRPLLVFGLSVAFLIAETGCHQRARATAASTSAMAAPADPAKAVDAETRVKTKIPPRSTFITACAPFHLDATLLQSLIQTARPVYNLARIRAGNTLTLVNGPHGHPRALIYDLDSNRQLWLPDQNGKWTAAIEKVPYVIKLARVSGTVNSSLFDAVESAGEQDALAIDIANIFGWDLDFNMDSRHGDIFRVLVDKKYLDGRFAGYGQIVAAEYVNGGQAYDALRFHDSAGELAYYRPNGEPMKREFLKSPLRFAARISSPFNMRRFQPILKYYRPHLGTDFAAPTGTPVQTVGNGVVIHAGWKGEDGKMVEIHHANGYNTYYLHLSRILVHLGQHVVQGQTIGLVGQTGSATGPNLHFAITYDGRFENFELLRRKLPPAAPVNRSSMPQFQALRAKYMPELAALHPAIASAAVATTVPARH